MDVRLRTIDYKPESISVEIDIPSPKEILLKK